MNDFYEYDVVSIVDSDTGVIDINYLQQVLKNHGLEGWRLVNSFTNELGHNISTSLGYGTNTTIDQTILIFERCARRSKNV